MNRFFCIAIVFICWGNAIAQDNYPGTQVLPPSPEVASMEKYGSVPVNYYTGIPQISIPIYTLKSKSTVLPISISYHAQGIKVNDVSGPLGLGWSLNAGGYVTKYINGLEENDSGDLLSGFSSITEINNFINTYKGSNGEGWEDIYCGTFRDNDVDIYSYSAPGISGKFFTDNNDVIRQLPIQNVKIEHSFQGINETFSIKDFQGNRYGFSAIEEQKPLFNAASFQCTWIFGVTKTAKSSGIGSLDGGGISFHYEDISYKYLTDYSEFRIDDSGIGSTLSDVDNWSGVHVTTGKRITKIDTKEGYAVEFEYIENGGPGLLSRIIVSYAGKEFKWFDLKYNSYQVKNTNRATIANGEYHFSDRDKLVSITESGKGTHKFVYNNQPLPPRFSYAQDFWGYYNGMDHNTTLIPTKSPEGVPYNVSFATGNREADAYFMKSGILEEVIFPTGGSTKFTYESNEREIAGADSQGCVTELQSKGVFVEASATSGNCIDVIDDSHTFNIPSGSENVKLYINSNTSATDPPPLDCVHNREINKLLVSSPGLQSVAWTGQSMISMPSGFSGDITVDFFVNGYNSLNELITTSVNIVWQEPVTTCPNAVGQPPSQPLGGLRIRKIENFKDQTSDPIKRVFEYDNIVYQLPKFNSYKMAYTLFDGCYYEINELIGTLSSNSIVNSTTLFGGAVAYNKVTEYFGDPAGWCFVNENDVEECPTLPPPLGKIEYIYDHQKDGLVINPVFGFGATVDYAHRRGQLLENKVFKYVEGALNPEEGYYITNYSINTYETDSPSSYVHYGIKVAQLRNEVISDCGSLPNFFPAIYDYQEYPHHSEWIYLDNTVNHEYFYSSASPTVINGTRTSTTTYSYNSSNRQPDVITTVHPDRTKRTTYTYGLKRAIGVATNILTEERENAINPFMEIRSEKKNFSCPSLSLNCYLTYYIISQESQYLTDLRIDYEGDELLGPFRIKGEENELSEIYTSYDYEEPDGNGNYTNYPSAKCNNCASVYYRSFEVDATAILDPWAKTGKYSYQLSNGSIQIEAPSNYKIDYWIKPTINGSWNRSSVATYSNGKHIISSGTGFIDDVRVYPPDGEVTTYTYLPSGQIASVMDQNGRVTRYEYDTGAGGRLTQIIDNDGNVLQEFRYHIKNFD